MTPLLWRMLRFGLVGAAGFVVDATVLGLLLGLVGPYWGRLGSFAVAVVTTWLLNRSFTFGDRRRRHSLSGEFGRYLASMIAGGAVNYGVYAGVLHFAGSAGFMPYLALAAGSLGGLAINLTLANFVVFRH